MKTIRFCADYPKLHKQQKAELLAVRRIKIDRNTPPELLEYDTTKTDGSRYNLKHGNYLQLIFLGNSGIPFCTIRSACPESKVEYYRKSIGETFEIRIEAE